MILLFINMKLKLLFPFLFIVTTSFADNEACLIIKQKSGNETIFEFSTNPVITFEGEEMLVKNDFTTFYVPLDDIFEYRLKKVVSAIKDTSIKPLFTKGHVTFLGISKNTPIYVYTMDGKMVKKLFSDDGGNADVNVEDLPKGTYIIISNNTKIKVINNK